jgi:hypothetical protein
MLESLYEEAINKKGTIQEQIVEYQHKDLDLSKNWIVPFLFIASSYNDSNI